MNGEAPIRLAVFTGDLSYSVRKGIVDIDAMIPGLSWLVLVHEPRKSAAQLLRNQRLNIRRNGWRWIPYQAAEVLRRLWPARRSGRTAPGAPGREYELDALEQMPNLRLLSVPDLHGSAGLQALAQFRPRLGLSLAAPILKPSVFAAPQLGTLNLHKGKVPEFRGMPPAFWEMWSGQSSVGCTVHWVDERLDTGKVVAEAAVAVSPASTVRALQLQLDEVGASLMTQAVHDVLAGRAAARAQAPFNGPAHRKPTLAQQAEMGRRERDRERARAAAPRWQRAAKEAACAVAYAAGRTARHLQTPRATVLLYHRVSDEVRDNLTVGVAQFERQMRLLRERCDVVSLEEVLAMREVPRSPRPLVAVTFDDGYLDNFEHAAPVLRRHRIPAAFFVATGIVASEQRFPHDIKRGNPWIPVMNWEQLRHMKQWGFTIGSHTVNHIDIASAPAAAVREELARSRDDLRRELDVREPILAYPYGGRQHMSAERLPWVREAGYVACLAAYGGTNIGTVDPFNVLRRGIHWEFTERAFLVQALGMR